MKKHISAIMLALPVLVSAADKPVNNEWKGEGELGFTQTSGNTKAESLNAKLGVEKKQKKWKHKAALETLQSSADGTESANRMVITARTEYKISKKIYTFAGLRYEKDKFSGYDHQSSLSLGIGKEFINNDSHELDASLGFGYRQVKDSATSNVSGDGIVAANLNYLYKISKYAAFKEKLLIESGDTNTYIESETSLKMKINGNLSSKIAYTIKQNSSVPVGTKKTDTVTIIALVYGF